MAKNSLIQVFVEEELKRDADQLFDTLGMDTATAIKIFLKQSIMRNGVPFPLVVNTDDFYSSDNMNFLEEAAIRVKNKENVVIKTMEELEALENE